MKIVKKLLLTGEEEKHLQWIIDWYDNHDNALQAYGIDVTDDLYDIIDQVLADCEVSEEAEED